MATKRKPLDLQQVLDEVAQRVDDRDRALLELLDQIMDRLCEIADAYCDQARLYVELDKVSGAVLMVHDKLGGYDEPTRDRDPELPYYKRRARREAAKNNWHTMTPPAWEKPRK